MKKKQVILIASLVHLILWTLFLLVSVVEKLTYQVPDMEPLQFALSKGVYNVFIIVAIAGIVNSTVLHLSLCVNSSTLNMKCKRIRVSALYFSAIATILFYSSAVLLFLINTDVIVIFPIAWFFCELCCGVLLVFSLKSK